MVILRFILWQQCTSVKRCCAIHGQKVVLQLFAPHRDAGGGAGRVRWIIQQSFISSVSSSSHPLDCSRPGRDRPLEQIVNYDVYCAAHSRLGRPGGEGVGCGGGGRGLWEQERGAGRLKVCGGEPLLFSPARFHSSFGLIWCLVCVTPATEAKVDNPPPSYPVPPPTQWIFPQRGGGGVFNIGLGSPEAVECTTRQIKTNK